MAANDIQLGHIYAESVLSCGMLQNMRTFTSGGQKFMRVRSHRSCVLRLVDVVAVLPQIASPEIVSCHPLPLQPLPATISSSPEKPAVLPPLVLVIGRFAT